MTEPAAGTRSIVVERVMPHPSEKVLGPSGKRSAQGWR